jgi:Tol biopolymer transport system component
VGPTPAGDSSGLFVISIFGGTPRLLRDGGGRAAVAPDGKRIAFVNGRGNSEIWLMGSAGEDPHQLVAAREGEQFVQLQWSPDSQRVAFLRMRNTGATAEVELASRAIDQQNDVRLVSNAGLRSFCWAADGRVIYSADEPGSNANESNLWAIRVASRTGQPDGGPQRVTQWPGFAFSDLSITGDGKQLAFVRTGEESNILVSDLSRGKNASEPQRITSDERHDVPTAWTPDGRALYFHSDRNGNWDIFRQSLPPARAEEVLLGPEEQLDARFTPDGSALLVWSYAAAQANSKMRLLRVAPAGGAEQQVLEARAGARFRCPRSAGACVVGEPDSERHQVVFSSFDPQQGRGAELFRVAADPYVAPSWDLSPDGKTLALVNVAASQNNDVQLHRLADNSTRTIKISEKVVNLSDVAWNSDGEALLLTAVSGRGANLLMSDLSGRAHIVASTIHSLTTPVPSPDGKRAAYGITSQTSNAWLLTNF